VPARRKALGMHRGNSGIIVVAQPVKGHHVILPPYWPIGFSG
jgi:hypothetical protein